VPRTDRRTERDRQSTPGGRIRWCGRDGPFGPPPLRSVRAELPHTAPTSGVGVDLTLAVSRLTMIRAQGPDDVRQSRSLRLQAFPPRLRRSPSTAHRYYALIRLPRAVHDGRSGCSLHHPALTAYADIEQRVGLPVLVLEGSRRASGRRPRRTGAHLALTMRSVWPSRYMHRVGVRKLLSGLSIRAHRCPCQRFGHHLTVMAA